MSNCFTFLTIFLSLFLYISAFSQDQTILSRDQAVLVNAKVIDTGSEQQPGIVITWHSNRQARSYNIYKKGMYEPLFSAIAENITDTTYTDRDIEPGIIYEYEVEALSNGITNNVAVDYNAYGYIASGIAVNAIDNFGKVLLLIDSTVAVPLQFEIHRLEDDLVTEGWHVVTKYVDRTTSFDGAAVKKVKNLIKSEYLNEKDNPLVSVFLIGRVAVPYSGDLNPDGHDNHKGAWPADVYYACISESGWTDNIVNDTSSYRIETKNIPNDGKFDQSTIPGNIDLQVGRVDFYNMGHFNESEVELLRKYLDKDHLYRTGQMSYEYKALIDDNFNGMTEAFASSGWRNLAALVGSDNITTEDWFETLSTKKYLWAYGCGGGWFQGASGIGTDSNFAATQVNSIFTMLFGSYFGDWDSDNNFLRCALASQPSILTCSWAGRPGWFYHHLGMGLPIGYSTNLTQNNLGSYLTNLIYSGSGAFNYVANLKGVNIALMGDPTLRMFMGSVEEPLLQPENVSVIQPHGEFPQIKWEAPNMKDIAGYNVYRSLRMDGPWTMANKALITGTSFKDNNYKHDGTTYYMVRTVKLQESYTGSFYNMSRGVIKDIVTSGVEDNLTSKFSIICNPNPARENVNITLTLSNPCNAGIIVYDIKGQPVFNLVSVQLDAGSHQFTWNLKGNEGIRVSPGIYIIKFALGERTEVVKINVVE